MVDLSLAGDDVTLTVQTPAEYPAEDAVKLPRVLQMVEHFFRPGQLPRDARGLPIEAGCLKKNTICHGYKATSKTLVVRMPS